MSTLRSVLLMKRMKIMKINLYSQGVNGPLQQRVNILNSDLIQTNADLNNCDNDPEKCNPMGLSTTFIDLLLSISLNIPLHRYIFK